MTNIKKLTILSMFLLFSSLVNAQVLLGDSESFIMQFLTKRNFKLRERKNLENSGVSLTFNIEDDGDIDYIYYLNQNICVRHVLIAPKKALLAFIQGFNKDFIKVSDNIWIDKEYETKYEVTARNDNPYFTVTCTKVSN